MVAVGEGKPAHGLEAHLLHQASLGANEFHILLLKDHRLARPLAPRLLAGMTRPANHGAPAEGVEAIHQHEPEAVAVGNQQGDGDDPPHDAEHGQHAAQAIALQGLPGLAEDFSEHRSLSVLQYVSISVCQRLGHSSRSVRQQKQPPRPPISGN